MAANVCPNVPDNWRGNLSEAAALLGIHRDTLRRYVKVGRRQGGIDAQINRKGQFRISGKEVKRFWVELL